MKNGMTGFKMLVAGVALAATLLAVDARAADTLLFVSPLRVVIGSGNDTETLSITNKSTKQHRYVISMVDQAMGGDALTRTVDTFPYSAKKMIRYMPRQVVLDPGQRQVVRLMVRRPEGIPAGDYHTHLLFDEKILQAETSTSTPPVKGLKMEITTQYSVAVPLVVQVGEVRSSISLDSVSLTADAKGQPQLSLGLTRGGNAEAQADINATLDGKPLAKPRRVRLYHEVDQAHVEMPLTVPLDKALSGKVARVTLNVSPGTGTAATTQTKELILP